MFVCKTCQRFVPVSQDVRGCDDEAICWHCLYEQRDELLEACKVAMPHILWACTHGSRCDEAVKVVTDAIMKAKGQP